nr:pseudouridine-5'-phosphate glycosidase [Anaerolineae bacterium]
DLPELAGTPVAVICAGAKVILDLPRTREYLETSGVPVLGWKTDSFPAFYGLHSDLPVDDRVDTPEEVAAIMRVKWDLGLAGGILITVPPPPELALPQEELEDAVQAALLRAEEAQIKGKALTPFLLEQIGSITGGRSLAVNIALLEQNARIAAGIAKAFSKIMTL